MTDSRTATVFAAIDHLRRQCHGDTPFCDKTLAQLLDRLAGVFDKLSETERADILPSAVGVVELVKIVLEVSDARDKRNRVMMPLLRIKQNLTEIGAVDSPSLLARMFARGGHPASRTIRAICERCEERLVWQIGYQRP